METTINGTRTVPGKADGDRGNSAGSCRLQRSSAKKSHDHQLGSPHLHKAAAIVEAVALEPPAGSDKMPMESVFSLMSDEHKFMANTDERIPFCAASSESSSSKPP